MLPEAPHPTRTVELLFQSANQSFKNAGMLDSSSREFQRSPMEAPQTPKQAGERAFLESSTVEGGSCSSTSTLSTEDLVRHWWSQAEDAHRRKGHGSLSTQDKQVIALRVCQLMREMDLGCKGHVDNEEWVHYTMLKHSDRASTQINSLLREALKKHPELLEDLQRLFKAADAARSGRLSFHEVSQMYSRKLWHIHPSNDLLSEAELQAGDPEQFARDIIKAMDVDGDETISYAEFMAFCLGRRKQQVVLHMYDLSAGMGMSLTPILGEEMEHIWHTGLVVYDREYFWASDTVHDVPGKTSFGAPTKTVELGFTLWRQEELHDFIISELQPIFHRETYDHITNNCNHFTDRLCQYLLGRRLPDEVLQQTEHLMKLTTIKLLRPVLQWYCRDNLGPGKASAVAKTAKWDAIESGDRLVAGTIVEVHPVQEGDGAVVFGVVCDSLESQPKRIIRNESAMPSLLCSCNTMQRVSSNEVWVRYFDISLNQSLYSCDGQVRVEAMPRSRLSVTELKSAGIASVYHSAMALMNASGSRRNVGASGGLTKPTPAAVIPSMGFEDELLEDRDTDANGNGNTLWSVMGSANKENDAIQELVAKGYDVQAASAALASMDWQLNEASALLAGRERLRRAAAANQSGCQLKLRIGPMPRPRPGDGDTLPVSRDQRCQDRSRPMLGLSSPVYRPGKAIPDDPVEAPDFDPEPSSAWTKGVLTI